MAGHIRLAGFITTLLVIFLPSFTLAQDVNFGVVPAEVRINDLSPGETAEFDLTIHNNDAVPRIFTLTTYPPPAGEEREGRTQFPYGSWISFSYPEIKVAADSEANVTVTVAIPQEQKWAGEDWETWLGVAAESSDPLGVKLYVRLLVSTNSVVGGKSNIGLFAGIAVAIVLLGYGGYYYFRRKAKPV
jgi:hypothetical protein